MKLIIMRHGEAESGINDPNRKLTEQGKIDIARAGRLIAACGWKFVEIRHSPLVRTTESATIVQEEIRKSLNLDIPLIKDSRFAPGMLQEDITEFFNNYGVSDAAIWVFHSPEVSYVTSILLGAPETVLYFPPGTAFALNLSMPDPTGKGMIIWSMIPEILRDYK